MATWALPPTIATGSPVPSTTINDIINNEAFLYQKPYFNGYDASGAAAVNNTLTQIPITARISNYGMFLSGGLVVVPLTGIYFVSGQVWSVAASGTIDCTFNVEGNTGIISARTPLSSGYTGVSASGVISLAANQYVGLYTTQTSGGTINMTAGLTSMSVYFIGSQ